MDKQTFLLSDTIIFDGKPIAVPYNYRISYKISQLMLIIQLCCSSRSGCSLIKLHLLSAFLDPNTSFHQLLDIADGKISEIPVIRFDPVVNRALLYAVSEGAIVQQKDGKYKLSPVGKKYVALIMEENSLMLREKELLSKISTRITEQIIKDIISNWRYGNATTQPC